MRRFLTVLVVVCAVPASDRSVSAGLTIDTVRVGNAGNPGELSGGDPEHPERTCGAVDYVYEIGKYEVTAGQYTEFLNAVAADDTYGVYNEFMVIGSGIERAGAPGAYTYGVAPAWQNRPVTYVSWGDAARFSNWMHNGQPAGGQDETSTEDGAYALNGAISDADLLAVRRQANWTWAIPTEDEWYKAAYHKNDGATANYWDYPTSSDSDPSNNLESPDPGNNATFFDGDYTIGSPYYRTEVGAHENSDSPYGTFDQGGNVWEYNESVIGWWRGLRGGAFHNSDLFYLHASCRHHSCPASGSVSVGFRLVHVPEPSSLVLLGLGSLIVVRRR